MLKLLKISVSAIALSAFVVAPIATVVTADYAYAKNGNGNGKGGGNGGGNGGGKGNSGDKGGGGNKGGNSGDKGNKGGGNKGKSADKGNKGKGADKAHKSRAANSNKGKKSTKGFARTVKDDFKSLSRSLKQNGLAGLLQKNSKPKRATATRQYTAPVKSSRPPARLAKFDKDALHPSSLGKLNGAINSSPRAKTAHIANGNYLKGTGPVSLAAALAVADFDFAIATKAYDDAVETIALNDAFDLLEDDSLPTPEEARDILDDAEENPDDYTEQEIEDAEKVVEAADLTEGEKRPGEDTLNEAVDTVEAGEPDDADVIAAEDAVLAAHKRGDLAEEDEEDVLDAVRDSNPTEEAIEDALGRGMEDEPDDDEDDVTIDAEDPEETPFDSAMVENAPRPSAEVTP